MVAWALASVPVGAMGGRNIIVGDGFAVADFAVRAVVQVGGPFVVFGSVRVNAIYEDSAAGGDRDQSLVLLAEV